ncbi:MAG: hypothetical protein ACTSR8_04230 [Promethearchaeota archaeon]
MFLGYIILYMSMDKWLSDKTPKKHLSNKSEENYTEQDLQKAKLEQIRKLIGKNQINKVEKISFEKEDDEFLSTFYEFKQWLDQRTYLKGDLNQIEMWIKLLYRKIYTPPLESIIDSTYKNKLKEKYKKIPPNFIEEKIRIAINKKMHGMKKTSSDTYYLKKLRDIIQIKLKEAKYYKTLKQILDL